MDGGAHRDPARGIPPPFRCRASAPVPPSRAIDTPPPPRPSQGLRPPITSSRKPILPVMPGPALPQPPDGRRLSDPRRTGSAGMGVVPNTRSGKTRFARYSLACEFWCVSLNRATSGSVISQCRPLRAYSQPRSCAPSTPKLYHSLRNRKRHHESGFCRDECLWHTQLLWASTVAAEDGSSPDHWRVV